VADAEVADAEVADADQVTDPQRPQPVERSCEGKVVVAVALVPARRVMVARELGRVVAAGGRGVLVTADGGAGTTWLPDGVELVDLADREPDVMPLRVLSSPVFHLPDLVRRRPLQKRPWAWRAWRTTRAHSAVRPYVIWRALRPQLRALRLERVDYVLVVSVESWPITWQLLRRSPDAGYGWNVPTEWVGHLPYPDPPSDPPE
jgi:hypothetical protein